MNPTRDRKWTVWGAALTGLAMTSCILLINSLVDGGKELSVRLNASPPEMIGYFATRLLWLPIIMALVVFVHNFFGKPRAAS
jgi:hypothetical protein